MGIRLAEEVLEASWPTPLTHREKLLLVVLALDANDGTRMTWNSIERPENLLAAQVNRAQLYAVVKQLIAKGALRRVVAGQRNAEAKYEIGQCQQIPDSEVPVEGQQFPDADRSQCQGFPDTEPSQCQGIPDTVPGLSVSKSLTLNPGSVSANPMLSVRESLTPTRTTRTSKNTQAPAAPSAPDRFDEFWSAYPRKVGKADARRAWTKAMKTADPEQVIAAVRRHRDHHARAATEARYIPHPATWLNGERYDDEPEPAPRPAGAPAQHDYADRGIF